MTGIDKEQDSDQIKHMLMRYGSLNYRVNSGVTRSGLAKDRENK